MVGVDVQGGAVPVLAEEESPAGLGRLEVAALAISSVLVVANFWWPALFASLRHDENLTAWVTDDSLGDAISRSWEFQGQSPVYFVIVWLWRAVAGGSDLALRLPSILATGVACVQLVKLGTTLDSRRTGLIAAGVYVTLPIWIVEARPYAFQLLALIVAMRLALAWRANPRLELALGWAFCLAFAVWMQPFSVYAFAPFGLIALRRMDDRRARLHVAAMAALGLVLLLPIVPQLMALADRQEQLVYVLVPGPLSWLSVLVPYQAAVGLLVALVIGRLGSFDARPLRADGAIVVLALWAVAPVAGIYIQSVLTGNSVFVEKYWAASLPAVALVVAMVSVRADRSIPIAVLACGIAASLVLERPGSFDWEGAVAVAEAQPADTPVWAVTGFIEGADHEFVADPSTTDYLNAPLIHHGLRNEVVSLPIELTPEARPYVDGLVAGAVEQDGPVVVIGLSWDALIGGRAAVELLIDAGFEIDELNEFGDLYAVVLSP